MMITESAAQVSSNSPTSTDNLSAGDIVVTASRRAESLSKTPLSITALNQAALDDQGIRDIADVARSTPGLTFSTTGQFGGTNLSIRGIYSEIGAATTGVYIDDTPVQVRNGVDAGLQPIYANIFDLDRVEVLRGPQGTLFGAGSEGGTVRYIMAQPSVDRFSAYGRAEIATTRKGALSYEGGLAAGGPLIEGKLGIRASAWGRREGGWVDRYNTRILPDGTLGAGTLAERNSNRSDLRAYRLALAAQPVEAVTITPSIMHQSNKSHDVGTYWEKVGPYRQLSTIPQPRSSIYTIASNTVTIDAGPVAITSVTSYLHAKGRNRIDETYFDMASISGFVGSDDLPPGSIHYPALPDFRADYLTRTTLNQWSQELRFATDADAPLSFVGGVYWQQTKSRSMQVEREPLFDALFLSLTGFTAEEFLGAPMIDGDISYQQRTRVEDGQIAAFGDLTARLTDRLKATAGLRGARTHFNFASLQQGPWNGGDLATSGRQVERPVTPKFGLSYDLDGGLLYATVAKGYRIGGANPSLVGNTACEDEVRETLGQDDVPLTYDSDSVWSYELGVKGRALDNRVNFAASVYQIDWSKIQGGITLQCLFGFTSNLGTARVRGGDLSISGRVADALLLGADLGYTDARYSEDYVFNGALLAGKGDGLRTPRFTAHLYADYRRELGSGGKGYLRVDYNHNSRRDLQPGPGVVGRDATIGRADPVSQLSARLGLQHDTWDLSLFVDNLLDDKGKQFRSRWRNSDYYMSGTPRPRTIGLTLTYSR